MTVDATFQLLSSHRRIFAFDRSVATPVVASLVTETALHVSQIDSQLTDSRLYSGRLYLARSVGHSDYHNARICHSDCRNDHSGRGDANSDALCDRRDT